MRLIVRFRGVPVTRVQLQEGRNYTVGRSSDNDIHYAHRSLSRRQGTLIYKEGSWYFLNEAHRPGDGAQPEYRIDSRMELPNGLELLFEATLEHEPTGLVDLQGIDRRYNSRGTTQGRRRLLVAALSASAAVLFALVGYLAFQRFYGAMDSNRLMAFASPKVVKFELIKNTAVQAALKKDASLADDDFRETVGYCTGFLVDTNVVLTAGHCYFGGSLLDASSKFLLRTSDNKEFRAKRVLGFDIQRDFLFLETEGMEGYGHLDFASSTEVGQKVYTLGNVEGEGLAIRDGIISGETEDTNNPEIKFIRYSAGASPGNSGGPLLNDRGEIVALVFARNMSENYNLGTAAEHLVVGFHTYVTDRSEKEITVDSKTLLNYSPSFTSYGFLASLGLPAPEALRNQPELGRVLENIDFKVKLPAAVETLAGSVATELNRVARTRVLETLRLLNDKDIAGEDWKSQVTKDAPIVVPATQPSSPHALFADIGDGVIAPKSFDFYEPGGAFGRDEAVDTFRKFKYFEYKTQAWSSPLLEHRLVDFAGRKAFANVPDNKEKLNLGMLMYQTIDTYFPDSSYVRSDRAQIDAEIKKLLVGQEGILIAPNIFPFLRPKGSRVFTLKEFAADFKPVRAIKDMTNRQWDLTSMKLYDRVSLDNYCTRSFAGRFCMTIAAVTEDDVLLNIQRENLVAFKLSSILLNGEYVRPSALPRDERGQIRATDATFADFTVRESGGRLRIGLKSFGQEFDLGNVGDVVSMNLMPGLMHPPGSQEPYWYALGVNFVRRVSTPGAGRLPASTGYQLCVAGVDFKAWKYHPLADLTSPAAVDAQDENRGPSAMPPAFLRGALRKEQLWTKPLATHIFQREEPMLFGSCLPLSVRPGQPGTYKLDVKAAKPLPLSATSLSGSAAYSSAARGGR